MGNMLYNGVELPVLSEEITSYMYQAITLVGSNYWAFCSDNKMYASGTKFGTQNAGYKFDIYILENGVWTAFWIGNTGNFTFSEDIEDNWWWGNYDSNIFTATSPVDPNAPVTTVSDEKYFILGTLCRRLLMGVEAKMYSYNGVVLPKLPEWDKEAYPYAIIVTWGTRKDFRVFDIPLAKEGEAAFGTSSYTREMCWMINDGDAGWTSLGENISQGGITFALSRFVWTNTDILDAEGNAYLPATDPIPVYA